MHISPAFLLYPSVQGRNFSLFPPRQGRPIKRPSSIEHRLYKRFTQSESGVFQSQKRASSESCCVVEIRPKWSRVKGAESD